MRKPEINQPNKKSAPRHSSARTRCPVKDEMSFPERRVAGLFDKWKLRWVYEKSLYVQDPAGRPRLWSPDFYLPDLGIFVEVVGIPGADYSFRQEVYSNNHVRVLFVRPHEEKWINKLVDEFRGIEVDRRRNFEAAFSGIRHARNRRPSTSG